MDRVRVYSLDGGPENFLESADAEGLIAVCRFSTPPEGSVFVSRFDSCCACSDPEKLIVDGDSIVVREGSHAVAGHPAYVLPPDCTTREALVVVTWLIKSRFYTFGTRVVKSRMRNGLERFLEPARFFQARPLRSCSGCVRHVLLGDPVFFLKGIVLSGRNKGPTLESALEG